MLIGVGSATGILAFFLFQMVFMDTAATIPTGSMAERLKFAGFVLMSLWVSMVVYPLVGGWVWGGGWLANLGRIAGLGNGAVDFAGSGVVHMIGGAIALAGALVIGSAHWAFQPGRLGQRHARSQYSHGRARYDHPLLRLVRLQSRLLAGLHRRWA